MMNRLSPIAGKRPLGTLWLFRVIATLAFSMAASLAHGTCVAGNLVPLQFGQLQTDNSQPIGSPIGSAVSQTITVTCSRTQHDPPATDTLTFHVSGGHSPVGDLWPTTQPGVGMRVSIGDTTISGDWKYTTQQPNDGTGKPYKVTVQLVRTGTIQPTASFTPDVFDLRAKDGSSSSPEYTLGTLHTVNTSFSGIACTVANDSLNKEVPLGEHSADEFHGVGSTVGRQAFQLNLKCDRVWPNPQTTPLSVRFDGTSVAGEPDLLSVNGASPATGIGIQLHWHDTGAAVPLGQWIARDPVSTASTPSLNLDAAYYQYAPQVGKGDANGQLTFTIQMR